MSSPAIRIAAVLAVLALLSPLVVCSGGGSDLQLSEAGQRGYATFAGFCVVCHNLKNPFADGPQGPGIARSPREVLEAKVLRGQYPPGYKPKRDTSLMPLHPHLKDRIDDLYAFLQEVPDPDAKPGPSAGK